MQSVQNSVCCNSSQIDFGQLASQRDGGVCRERENSAFEASRVQHSLSVIPVTSPSGRRRRMEIFKANLAQIGGVVKLDVR
jgi:hypothetical protein